jgi:hypothetical protein
MPVITKEALELLRKQTEMMPNREAAKVNWSGALLGFLLGEMLAGLTVNTTMAWLTVWAPFALPVVFIALPVVFAQIQYRHALRRYRPGASSAASPPPQPPLPQPPLAASPPPLPKAPDRSRPGKEWIVVALVLAFFGGSLAVAIWKKYALTIYWLHLL